MEPTTDISKRSFRIGAGLILLLALALRIWGAMGDFAQDEINSLHLAGTVSRFDQVFWKINNDNSHPLNTAWLYLVGPNASFIVMRALSIALGMGTMLAAGAWGLRKSRIGGLIAMALFATSYLMILFASEARGYAGMILCIVLAVTVVENILAGKGQKKLLGLVVLIGTLFHYDMVMAVGVLLLACFWLKVQTENFSEALDDILEIFILPVLAIIIAIMPMFLFPYTIGHIETFNIRHFLGADNLALQTSLNLPFLNLTDGDLMFATALSLLWFAKHRADFRAMFFVATIIIFPIGLWAFSIANTSLPRHMILSGIAYLMLATTLAEAAWHKNKKLRILACIGLLVILGGNAMLLSKLYHFKRGNYSAAVAVMTAQGPTTYSIDKPQLTPMIDFYSQRQHVTPPTFITLDEWCAKGAPQWMIVIHHMREPMPADHIMQGPDGCQANYVLQQDYPAWGLTGAYWVLFKRE